MSKKATGVPITERVKTFEDACNILGIKPEIAINQDGEKDEIAYQKLKIIARALNEGWQPDYSNGDERKYSPWFEFVPGSGFRFLDYAYEGTYTIVGSRLVFKIRELAEYAGKKFVDIYNDFLN